MNFTFAKHHAGLLAFYCICILLAILLSSVDVQVTPWSELEWSDVVGEGSIVLLTICWALALLMSRPAGRVTNLLIVGLGLFTFSAILDMLDEFTEHTSAINWISLFESLPAAVGMLIMSYALYLWHQEQVTLNRQLRGKELGHRWHQGIDPITQLYRPDYWKARAHEAMHAHDQNAVLALNVTDFSSFNHQFGSSEGDRRLRELSQLILMTIRDSDLACRYAGDRFIVLLPNTSIEHALILLKQITQSIEHVAFKPSNSELPIYASVWSVARTLQSHCDLDELLSQANHALDQQSELAA